MSLSQLRFASRVGVWLCLLPVLLRLRTLTSLLERSAFGGKRRNPGPALDPNRIVLGWQIVAALSLFVGWRIARMFR